MVAAIPTAAHAAVTLTVTPITWNVIGLDSNKVIVGPDTFVVGARACDTGSTAASNVVATLVWDSTNALINLSGPGSLSTSSLGAGRCYDFHFNVVITRNGLAYDSVRRYHISVSADGVGAVSTPTPRELYVEHLVSQNRNHVEAITGPGGIGDPPPTTVYVGQTYTYMLFSHTAPGGYEQLESFLNFPNVIFQVVSVATTYDTPPGATNDKVYADACGWQNDPTAPNYRSCVGPVNYAGGKAGGNVVTTYQVKILSTGNATVTSLIYDFSGSSYHYNNDFGVGINSLSLSALPSADMSVVKSHAGDFTVGTQGTYSLAVSNAGPSDAAGPVTVTDTLPNGLTYVSGTGTGWSCGAAAQTVTCTRGAGMTAGSSSTIALTVAVGGPAVPSVTNTASVSSSTHDPTPGNNSSSDPTHINRPPVAVDDAAATSKGVPVTITVKANDSDPDGDPLAVSISLPPANGSVVVNPDGTVTYTPGPGFAGTDAFHYRVCDPSGACASATVTVTVPTAVMFERASAIAARDGVRIVWRTGSEVDNVGFDLWRQVGPGGRRIPVNRSIVAGSALVVGPRTALTAGRTYEWLDRLRTVPHGLRYWIQEIDVRGRSVWHGPFAVLANHSQRADTRGPRWLRSPTLSRLEHVASPTASVIVPRVADPNADGTAPSRPWHPSGSVAVKLAVDHEGWYRVSLASLARLGLDVSDPGRLHLLAEGRDQAIEVDATWLQFYGLGLDTPSTETRVYWVVDAQPGGPRIPTVPFEGGDAGPADFPTAVERQDRTVYFASLLNGAQPNFFGDLVSPTVAHESLDVEQLSSTDGATVEVALQGVTDGPHAIQVSLNGNTLGSMSFDGRNNAVATFPAAAVAEGANDVALGSSGQADLSLVDHVILSFHHTFMADSDQLRFTAPAGSQVTVGGFDSSAIRAVDVTDPAAPIELTTVVDGGPTAFFATVSLLGAGSRTILAFAAARIQAPSSAAAAHPGALDVATSGADMVVLTARAFDPAVAPLVAERRRQGLRVKVVNVEDAYDAFAFGETDPGAVRDLMSYAARTWRVPPRYLLLFGIGTYDPRRYLGGTPDVVPTRLVDTARMETGSDAWFTDLDGDGVADVATGRIPVRTVDEARAVVSKLIAYDTSSPSGSVLIPTDVGDTYDFAGAADRLAQRVPAPLSVVRVARGDPGSKAMLIDAIDRGQTVVNYVGHGSVDLWRGNWLTADDAGALTNTGHLSLFVTMTCLNGYAYDPFEASLGEALLTAPAGAVGVWGSSAVTDPANQSVVNQALYGLLFDPGRPSGLSAMAVGEAAREALATVTDHDIRVSWVLLGDPSMVLR